MNTPTHPTRLAGTAAAALIAAGLVIAPLAHASTEDDLNARVASARAAAGCAPLTWAKPGATVAWYSSWINADYNIAEPGTRGSEYLFPEPPPIDLGVNPQTDPVGSLDKVGAKADRAVVIDQSDSRDRYAVDDLMNKAAGAIADCGYDTFGTGNYRRDGSDLSSVAVALYTAHKEAPSTGPRGGIDGIDKTVTIPPGLTENMTNSTVDYSLVAQGLPLASINISYLGDNNQIVNENNVGVTAGYKWTKTVTAKNTDTPWLKVSVNSAGLAGLKLDCSVAVDSMVQKVNAPDPNKSGTIEFKSGLTPEPAKACG